MKGLKEILMIEDSATDAALALRAFKRAKIANPLKVISSGEQALDYLFGTGTCAKRGAAKPLIILLDLNLPEMSGAEFLRRIRIDERTWQIPVVILTQSTSARKISACMRIDLDDYLIKPVDLEALVRVTKRLKLNLTLMAPDAAPGGNTPH